MFILDELCKMINVKWILFDLKCSSKMNGQRICSDMNESSIWWITLSS